MTTINEAIIFGDFINKTYKVFEDPIFSAIGFSGKSTFENYADNSILEYEDLFGALENALQIQTAANLILVGSFSYELGNEFEMIKKHALPGDFPLYAIYGFNNHSLKGYQDVEKCLASIKVEKHNFNLLELAEYSNFTKERYKNSIHEIRSQIENGNVYQVNLSQQFILPFLGNSFEYFLNLQKMHPSTYSCHFPVYSRQKDYGTVISHSPELFLNKSESTLVTKPIKGTRRRGLNELEDEMLKTELNSSNKDHAELSMIVDIERNDLGKICEIGSVTVDAHANLIERSNVYHLESIISGRLKEGLKFIDILKAMFPCGSITGAPKIAAQNIIATTEKLNREIYTGAIGVIYPNFDFTLNVAIRSCCISNNQIKFNSGGGIVYQSDADEEWMETLYKAKGLYETWKIVTEKYKTR